MDFIPVANTVLVQMVLSHDNWVAENTLYFTKGSAVAIEDMSEIAEDMSDWWSTHARPIVSNTYQLDKIIVTDLTTQYGLGIEYTTDLPISGQNVNAALPANVTVAVKFNTGYRGRSYRGRNYFIGLADQYFSGDHITEATVNSLDSLYTALITTPPGTGYVWSVVSRYANKAPRENGITTPITSVSLDDVVDSQRRRLPGRGQ